MSKYSILKIVSFAILILAYSNIFPEYTEGASWADAGAYSYTWYNKNKNEFHITTPEQMAGVAYLVNNNMTSFKGKTIYIDENLDFAGRTWRSIGIGSTTFQGTIKGGNHIFSNIEISDDSSDLYDQAGFWISLSNANISDLSMQGDLSVSVNIMGFIAAKATNTTFDNVNIDCTISFFKAFGNSTSYSYRSNIGGLIGESYSCKYNDVYIKGDIDYIYGYSNGSTCYGDIELNYGGIIGKGNEDKLFKCVANNKFYSLINGYETTNTYRVTPSSIIYGGMVGYLSGNSASITACLARNISFRGIHGSGTFDEVSFKYGGLVGTMMSDNAKLDNSVAINTTYKIIGNDYTWQASYYKTNSYFGGIAYYASCKVGGCYSNNDVDISLSKISVSLTKQNGNNNFSSQQMNTQDFVDEMNFYSQLKYDKDYWVLRNGFLFPFNERLDSSISTLDCEPLIHDDALSIFDLKGQYFGGEIGNLPSGIYIMKTPNKTKKIIVPTNNSSLNFE